MKKELLKSLELGCLMGCSIFTGLTVVIPWISKTGFWMTALGMIVSIVFVGLFAFCGHKIQQVIERMEK